MRVGSGEWGVGHPHHPPAAAKHLRIIFQAILGLCVAHRKPKSCTCMTSDHATTAARMAIAGPVGATPRGRRRICRG